MNAFDQFLQGDDALARLFAALSGVQSACALSSDFEPPAAMEANFLQQARAIAEAQTPRRDALLERLHKGESAKAVLGHPISAATQDWLASQQPSTLPQTKPHKPLRGWQWAGMILVPALLAGIGFQLLFPAQRGQPATAPQPAAALQLAETSKESAQSTAKALPNTRKKSHAIAERPLQLADSLPAPAARTNVPAAPAAPRIMAAAPPVPVETLAAPRVEPAPIMQTADKLALDSSKERAAPAPVAMVSPQRMAAEEMPRTAAAKLVLAKKSAALHPKIILLSDDPRLVAAALLPSPLGYIVRAAEPDSSAVRDWLTRLIEARHAHTALQIETDSTLASGQLLIFPINLEEK